ncbi:hypothetical protein Q73_03520 [Bacillus coahuilensis m2-6]|uniref:DUF3267 domain-containing protein n=1 Tax=Bacillus coahuilensis TaxID=408580 RepID=UPI0007978241|nr:DUF3267 domain-containing protein [Bacillus coahuilensis]KUP09156.1 hypothetical protein Q73_03520 [Bacillus coahuilensis m2-6]
MHCLKSVNIYKYYGFHRIFLLSLIVSFLVFSVIYVPLVLAFSSTLYDSHFILFVLGWIALYPLHKMVHLLPLLPVFKFVKIDAHIQFGFIPFFSIRIKEPIAKNLFICSLFSPFIVINTVLLLMCLAFPHYVHYIAILLAYHVGMCSSDFLYMKHILSTPKNAKIEDTNKGCEILVSTT